MATVGLKGLMCVLCVHGLWDSAIYRSGITAKLLYASTAWEGFANARQE